MPKVSVLLSIYKEPVEKIAPAVESILQQTFRDFEFLIAIDNPENTQAITYIENLARNDNRISLFVNEKNMGLGASLNRLIEAANGAYCARMDTEDISLPTRLEKQIWIFLTAFFWRKSSKAKPPDQLMNSKFFGLLFNKLFIKAIGNRAKWWPPMPIEVLFLISLDI